MVGSGYGTITVPIWRDTQKHSPSVTLPLSSCPPTWNICSAALGTSASLSPTLLLEFFPYLWAFLWGGTTLVLSYFLCVLGAQGPQLELFLLPQLSIPHWPWFSTDAVKADPSLTDTRYTATDPCQLLRGSNRGMLLASAGKSFSLHTSPSLRISIFNIGKFNPGPRIFPGPPVWNL